MILCVNDVFKWKIIKLFANDSIYSPFFFVVENSVFNYKFEKRDIILIYRIYK